MKNPNENAQQYTLKALPKLLASTSLAKLIEDGTLGSFDENHFSIHYLGIDEEVEKGGDEFVQMVEVQLPDFAKHLPEEKRKEFLSILSEVYDNYMFSTAKSAENVFDVLVSWYLHHHHGINLGGDESL